MKIGFKQILLSTILASIFTACGSVVDDGKDSITTNSTFEKTNDEKIAEYIHINYNHVKLSKNFTSTQRTRLYPGAPKEVRFNTATYFVTNTVIRENLLRELELQKASTSIFASLNMDNNSIETNIKRSNNFDRNRAFPITNISTIQDQYESGESIQVNLTGMLGDDEDWVGVYYLGADNSWKNVINWKWTGGLKDITMQLNGLSAGTYEIKAFFANSFIESASSIFTVVDSGIVQDPVVQDPVVQDPVVQDPVINQTTINTNKNQYIVGEKIKINLDGMPGHIEDWIGVFNILDNSTWGNILAWDWTGGIVSGVVELDGLSEGSYEVRAFHKGSYVESAISMFTVVRGDVQNPTENPTQTPVTTENPTQTPVTYDPNYVVYDQGIYKEVPEDSIMYEDAENNISANWEVILGTLTPQKVTLGYQSNGAIKLPTNWVTETLNDAEYHLPLNNTKHTTLEFDVGGVGASGGSIGGIFTGSKDGSMPHYSVGVYVTTKYGKRVMIWDSWFRHVNIESFRADYNEGNIWLYYPSPIELVRGLQYADNIDTWEHFKVDLNKYLIKLEPDNKIISVDTFTATGGFLDNIKLSNN